MGGEILLDTLQSKDKQINTDMFDTKKENVCAKNPQPELQSRSQAIAVVVSLLT